VFVLSFEAVSGLRVNLAKLELVPIGNVTNVEVLASILGCRVSSLLMKSIWDDIIEKIERRLAGWKMMYLSKVGSYLD
jgi:hypothetical protein